jgi:RNA polymerase sigma factor (sigma-70 family)
MNNELGLFEEVAKNFEPLIKSQIKGLRIYRDFDLYYQCGLIGLWEAYSRFQPEKGSFPAFAMQTIRGKMLSELKRESRYEEQHTAVEQSIIDTIADDEASSSVLAEEIVASYCETLSPKQKLWVEQAIILQKKQREIAEEFGVSSETVKSWRKEALKKLRENH